MLKSAKLNFMRNHPTTVAELAALLVKYGLVTKEQVTIINVKADAQKVRLTHSAQKGKKRITGGEVSPAEIIASLELTSPKDGSHLNEDDIVKCLAHGTGTPFVKIDPLKLDAGLITSTISLPFARRTSVLPLKKSGDILTVAVSDPYNRSLFEELERLTHCRLEIVLSPRSDIQQFITEVYGFKRSVAKAAVEMTEKVDIGNLEQLVNLGNVDEIEANDRHVVSAVEYVLHYAFNQRASDIHIELPW